MIKYPEQRKLCGVYYRVERDGKWQNICFSDLTRGEKYIILSRMEYETVRGLLETEVKAYQNLLKYCIETGVLSPEATMIAKKQAHIACYTDGGIVTLRRKVVDITVKMYRIAEKAGITCGYPEGYDGD